MTYKIRWKDEKDTWHDDEINESQLMAAHCSFSGVSTEGGHLISSHRIEFTDPKYNRKAIMDRLTNFSNPADLRNIPPHGWARGERSQKASVSCMTNVDECQS